MCCKHSRMRSFLSQRRSPPFSISLSLIFFYLSFLSCALRTSPQLFFSLRPFSSTFFFPQLIFLLFFFIHRPSFSFFTREGIHVCMYIGFSLFAKVTGKESEIEGEKSACLLFTTHFLVFRARFFRFPSSLSLSLSVSLSHSLSLSLSLSLSFPPLSCSASLFQGMSISNYRLST